MSGTWAEHLARERERYRRVTAGEATDAERELQATVDAYDLSFFATYGRYPEESRFNYAPDVNERRRAAIQALVERGATEGEREAATLAYARLYGDAEEEDGDIRDEEDSADFAAAVEEEEYEL